MTRISHTARLLAVAFLFSTALVRAQEVTLLAPRGILVAVDHLTPDFEKSTGLKVKPTYGIGAVIKAQVAKGDPSDLVIIQPPYADIIAGGNILGSSEKPLASAAVAIAVHKGAAKPDVSTPAALKATLLAAKSIACPDPAVNATAGVLFVAALKKMGIADQVQPKLKMATNGALAMALVARGEAEIGTTFASEMGDPGVEIAGMVPDQIIAPVTYVGFVSAHAKNAAGAQKLLNYLATPQAAAAYRAAHMIPAAH